MLFGKKIKFIKKAVQSFRKKGTAGSFTRWCRRHRFPGVTTGCINLAKKNVSLKIRRKAIFAQNIRSKKRTYTFGRHSFYRQCKRLKIKITIKRNGRRYYRSTKALKKAIKQKLKKLKFYKKKRTLRNK
jgi:hypothetical protein